MNPDAALLQHYARTRDAAAFTTLVQRYMPMVYRAAWRQLAGDAHAAEDVAQTVFTLLARKADGLGHHANLAGWLHVSTRHVVRDHLRAARRRGAREREALLMSEQVVANDAEVGADWNRLRPLLDEALGDLRPVDREALLLRYFQGLSLAAVGAALAVSEEAARMRVNRALERLREQLARHGIKSTATALGVVLAAEPAMAAPAAGLAVSVSQFALAQAAAVGGGAALAWPWLLMNSVKMVTTGAVALAAVGWATWEHARQEEILREAIRVESAPLAPAVQEKPPTTPAAPPASPAMAATVSVSRKTAAERSAEALARGEAFLAAHPKIRAAVIESACAAVAKQYAPYYVARRLTPAQRQAFEEIMIQSGAYGGMSFGDLETVGDINLRLPKLLTEDERYARLEVVLGAEEVAAFHAYREAQGPARYVREVAGWAMESDQPMTPEQGRLLQGILLSTPPPSGRNASTEAFWDAVIARATERLPAAQVEALVLIKARDELRWAESEAARRELRARAEKG